LYQNKLETLDYRYMRAHERLTATLGLMDSLERKIGCVLPEDYRVFLNQFGRIAFRGHATVPIHTLKPTQKGIVSVLFGFSTNPQSYDIRHEFQNYANRIPSNLLPIGADPGGNLFCISVTGNDKGIVYFWDHEHQENTFEQFQDRVTDLENIGINTKLLDTDQIILIWEFENQDRLPHPPGYGNMYKIAGSFEAFFNLIAAEE
ncbi:MAG: SMI1/KNR4 family protein, partial [Candidatus Promineifilaceae bacterium]